MKHILAVLIATFTLFAMAQAPAATINITGNTIDSLSHPLICDKDKEKDKKKKKGAEDEEPECD